MFGFELCFTFRARAHKPPKLVLIIGWLCRLGNLNADLLLPTISCCPTPPIPCHPPAGSFPPSASSTPRRLRTGTGLTLQKFSYCEIHGTRLCPRFCVSINGVNFAIPDPVAKRTLAPLRPAVPLLRARPC
jgi:hypothetical protein